MGQLFRMLWERRAWALLPPVVALLLVGALIVLSQATPLAPFIYPLF